MSLWRFPGGDTDAQGPENDGENIELKVCLVGVGAGIMYVCDGENDKNTEGGRDRRPK